MDILKCQYQNHINLKDKKDTLKDVCQIKIWKNIKLNKEMQYAFQVGEKINGKDNLQKNKRINERWKNGIKRIS